MTTRLQIRTMAALLHQTTRLEWLGWGIALVTVLVGLPQVHWDIVPCLLLVIAHRYYAFRVGFDANLLDAVASEADIDIAAASLDEALHVLGLKAAAGEARGWPSRWRGMRRLLLAQLAILILQMTWLLVVVLFLEQ